MYTGRRGAAASRRNRQGAWAQRHRDYYGRAWSRTGWDRQAGRLRRPGAKACHARCKPAPYPRGVRARGAADAAAGVAAGYDAGTVGRFSGRARRHTGLRAVGRQSVYHSDSRRSARICADASAQRNAVPGQVFRGGCRDAYHKRVRTRRGTDARAARCDFKLAEPDGGRLSKARRISGARNGARQE